MFSAEKDYRETLKEEFASRCTKNPLYSLRAFSRDIDTPFSRVSEVLNHKRGLSAEAALRISLKLGLSKKETELFVIQVNALHGRSRTTKLAAQRQIESLVQRQEGKSLQLDVFEVISNWYHYAIVELARVEDFQNDPAWIARRLGITPVEVELAIERMLNLGLLERKGNRIRAAQQFIASTCDIPSAGLKKHHDQILEKARHSIFLQSLTERDLSAITMAIDPKDLPEAKALLKKFRREFSKKMESSANKQAVYCLALQFFRLDRKPQQL